MSLIKRVLSVLTFTGAAPPAGYGTAMEGRAEITIGADTVQIPLVHAVDDAGNSLLPLTNAELRSASLLVQAAATDVALAAMSAKLPESVGQKTSAASLPVVLASDQPAIGVKAATNEALSYFSAVAVIPTGLTTGLNLWFIRNTSATTKIKINRIETLATFSGTAAASRSLYALKKFTGATATLGTVTLTPVAGVNTNAATVAELKWAAAGGTLTGATVGGAAFEIGHANQLTANITNDRDLSGSPIVLLQNEGLVLQTDGTVVVGSAIAISVRWTEEPV